MIVKVQVPDDVYQQYESYNSNGPEKAMSQQLIRFRDVSPNSRVMVLPNRVRAEMEKILKDTIDSPEDLLRIMKNLLGVKVGGVEVNLDPFQAKRLEEWARFNGKTSEVYLREQVKYWVDQTTGG